MPPEMLWPLLLCILSWALVSGAIFLLRLQNEIIRREIKRPWVLSMVSGSSESMPSDGNEQGSSDSHASKQQQAQ